ncbi:zinc finger protein ZAT5-like [Phalaenopsis equestris]|uniref:zinc finger protein ZAT5-like n=1 Tax=Phalaenopsis equestris TaxID=78828 RepID=UPI0009E58158|nr:zinc finger protein ZAT5-like [Phalaenopsis equestris]
MRIKVPSFSEVLATKELNIQNHGSKLHECSICGKVFASGQALGGHKRRHLVAADNAASTPAPADAVQASAAVTANMEQISYVSARLISTFQLWKMKVMMIMRK